MATVINKRQQARNERTLQELLKQPGNDRCADCFTRNPGWASWSLGVFLCMRCASIHRKLGTHISKVKSLSMDTWSLEQVENMKTTGNIVSNRRYNPKQQKPNLPTDADEIDPAMERFIREKYQHKTLCGEGRPLPSIKHHTGSSSGSSNDVPPPLPAKNGPRLSANIRSSSAMYPHSNNNNPLPSPPASDFSSSSRRMAGIPEDGPISRDHSFDNKLDTLREMGFLNESRNSTILKGNGGNVDKAVETLVRLGEGNGTTGASVQKPAQTNGISFETTGSSSHSTNGMSTPNSAPHHAQSISNGSNPFLRTAPTPAQPTQPPGMQSFEQSFQNMSIAQPQSQPQQPTQSLFPNNTGSWTAQRPSAPGMQSNPFLKTFTPPVSPSPYQYQTMPSQQQAANPFLRTSQSQTFAPSNPFGNSYHSPEQGQLPTSIPNWIQQQQPTGAPAPQTGYSNLQQQQQQQQPPHQQTFFTQQSVQSPTALDASLQNSTPVAQQQQPQTYFDTIQHQPTQFQQPYSNPQMQHGVQPQQFQPFQQPQTQIFQQQQQQQPFHDKTSILALYNTPNSYTQNPQSLQSQLPQQSQPQSQAQFQPQPQPQPQPHPQPAQRSVTMPLMSSPNSNPFTSLAPNPAQQPTAGLGHVSRESMAFTGGRSASPDAFSGLSSQWR